MGSKKRAKKPVKKKKPLKKKKVTRAKKRLKPLNVTAASAETAPSSPPSPNASAMSGEAEVFTKEDHACSTGDCGHDVQAQCEETLAADFPDEPSADPGPECA